MNEYHNKTVPLCQEKQNMETHAIFSVVFKVYTTGIKQCLLITKKITHILTKKCIFLSTLTTFISIIQLGAPRAS